MAYTIKLSTRGRITIPKQLREQLGLVGGERFEWTLRGRSIEGRAVEVAEGAPIPADG